MELNYLISWYAYCALWNLSSASTFYRHWIVESFISFSSFAQTFEVVSPTTLELDNHWVPALKHSSLPIFLKWLIHVYIVIIRLYFFVNMKPKPFTYGKGLWWEWRIEDQTSLSLLKLMVLHVYSLKVLSLRGWSLWFVSKKLYNKLCFDARTQ